MKKFHKRTSSLDAFFHFVEFVRENPLIFLKNYVYILEFGERTIILLTKNLFEYNKFTYIFHSMPLASYVQIQLKA